MSVEYSEKIRNQILSHLDGWVVYSTDPQPSDEVEPFIEDIADYRDTPNKRVTDREVESFYEEALEKAYIHCNRFNVDDLSEVELNLFLRGVCLLTASDLWNKYNIRVNNEDMEDTYVQSYGGLLYKQAVMILNSFINQRVSNLSSYKKNADRRENSWI